MANTGDVLLNIEAGTDSCAGSKVRDGQDQHAEVLRHRSTGFVRSNPTPPRMSDTAGNIITVFLVEDQEIVRLGLRAILGQSDRVQIVGEASTVEEARTSIPASNPDVVLMDLRLPDGTGIELCREIRDSCPGARVLFLSSYSDDETTLSAVMAGASGYIFKEITSERLLKSIELVAAGHTIFNNRILHQLQQWARGQDRASSADKDLNLTAQQWKVLALVAAGKTNKEIGEALGLSDKTVRNYLVDIFDKLHISRRTQAASFYTKHFGNPAKDARREDPPTN